MVKGDIVQYNHTDGRQFYAIISGLQYERVRLNILLLRDNGRHEWNTTFLAKPERIKLLEAV